MPAERYTAVNDRVQTVLTATNVDTAIDDHADLLDALEGNLDASGGTVGDVLVYNKDDELFEPGDLYWRDMISELYTRGGPSAPSATEFITGIYAYELVYNQTRTVFSNFHLNHDWAPGTKLYPHIHFSPNTNSTGDVVFQFSWTAAKGHGQAVFPAVTTKTLTFTIPANSAHTHFIAELPEIDSVDGTNLEVDSLILMSISRLGADAADTFADSVWGLTVDLHYQASKFGTPNKTPNFYT